MAKGRQTMSPVGEGLKALFGSMAGNGNRLAGTMIPNGNGSEQVSCDALQCVSLLDTCVFIRDTCT